MSPTPAQHARAEIAALGGAGPRAGEGGRLLDALLDAAALTGHPVREMARARILAVAGNQVLADRVCEAALTVAPASLANAQPPSRPTAPSRPRWRIRSRGARERLTSQDSADR